MPLTRTDFVAKGGSYYAHIFENARSGLPRALYWSFTVDFGRINYLRENWDSSLTVEWITLGVREFAGTHPISSAASPAAGRRFAWQSITQLTVGMRGYRGMLRRRSASSITMCDSIFRGLTGIQFRGFISRGEFLFSLTVSSLCLTICFLSRGRLVRPASCLDNILMSPVLGWTRIGGMCFGHKCSQGVRKANRPPAGKAPMRHDWRVVGDRFPSGK
jgi:hypothetical protein